MPIRTWAFVSTTGVPCLDLAPDSRLDAATMAPPSLRWAISEIQLEIGVPGRAPRWTLTDETQVTPANPHDSARRGLS